MINFMYLLILYAAHVILVHVLKGLKNNIASGVDLALTGALLAGYWYGFKIGFIIGCIFELTNNLVQMEFNPSMFLLIPLVGVMGIWGSIIPLVGLPIMNSALIGITIYWITSSAGMMLLFGERDFVNMGSFFLGSIIINWIFFDLFF